MTHPGDVLAPFNSLMVDDRHRALARMALDWALLQSTCPDINDQAKQAFLASTFGVFCEPGLPTIEESFHSLKFLLIVFKVDDAAPVVLEKFIPRLSEGSGVGLADEPSELSSCYQDMIKELLASGRDPTEFQEALRSMCMSMLVEKRSDKERLTKEEFQRLRMEVIAVRAFSECWKSIRRISFRPGLREALLRSAILDTASEIAYLANDIGSFDRDEEAARTDPQNVDPNFVLFCQRTLGDRETALRSVIDLHNARIRDFLQAERLLRETEYYADPSLDSYLTILRCTVNGNLATTKHLAPMRYQGSADALSRLHSL